MFFKQDIEATVNLRYITSGSLKTSGRNFNPKSGHIKLSLRVDHEGWRPRMGFHKWNSTSRTFTEVSYNRLKKTMASSFPISNIFDTVLNRL